MLTPSEIGKKGCLVCEALLYPVREVVIMGHVLIFSGQACQS